MDKLLIIDGSGLLVSNYYGTLPPEVQYAKTEEEAKLHYDKIAKRNGKYINAIYPTVKQIIEYTILSKANYLAVCFDKSRATTFRKDLYNDYKANRKKTPIPLKEQFILCENLLSELGITVLYHDKYEADDLAGSISKQISKKDLEKIILSKDKDYLQLADKETTIWMMLYKKEMADEILLKYGLVKDYGYEEYLPDKVVPYNLEIIKHEKGIDAINFSEVLAIAGDNADNIPGVKGVSEETAQKLIGKYKTVKALYEDIDKHLLDKNIPQLKLEWKNDLKIKRSPYNALMEYRDEAFLSSKLTKIKTDIDLEEIISGFNLSSLELKGFILDKYKTNTYMTSTLRSEIQNEINLYIDNK